MSNSNAAYKMSLFENVNVEAAHTILTFEWVNTSQLNREQCTSSEGTYSQLVN